MWAINFDRVFECFLREMLGRGHEVRVLLDVSKSGLPASATQLFDALAAEYPAFTYEMPADRPHPWMRTATKLRMGIDFLRYLTPEYEHADALRERMRARTPWLVRTFVGLSRRGPRWHAAVGGALRGFERAIPVPDAVVELIRDHRPDVVLVTPVIGAGTAQVDYLRAAAQLGIPTVLPVASWDNLTNKGVVKEPPTLTVVWNEAQIDEAERLHGIPRERVLATGAHSYDHWFGWEVSTTPEAFAARAGLDPGRPFILYVCSSGFIAGAEAHFIEEWVAHLRGSGDERLREVGVLVRPHPQNVGYWREHEVADPLVAVWPRAGAAPTDDQRKRDYYDSIFHASAVVGINTSAQVEAAIVGRPVFTLVDERFRKTQEGTLHFAHLAGASGDGMLVVAQDWEEHLDQLARTLAEPGLHDRRIATFVATFARPHGLGEAGSPRFADAVEQVAAAGAEPVVIDGRLTAVLQALTPAARLLGRAGAGGAQLRARRPRRMRRRARRYARHSFGMVLVTVARVVRGLVAYLPARTRARLPAIVVAAKPLPPESQTEAAAADGAPESVIPRGGR